MERVLSPPSRSLGVVTLCLVAASTPVAAQQPSVGDPTFSPLAGALASAFVTFLVAGGLVALKPDYTERTTDRILDAPGKTFIYGIGIGILGGIVAVVLVFTVIGIVVSVPILIVLAVIGYLGFLAAGRVVSESWGTVVAVAVAVAAVAGGIPVLGGFIELVLGSMGAGAAYLDCRDDGQSRSRTRDGIQKPDRPDGSGRSTGRTVGGPDSDRRSGPSPGSEADNEAGRFGRPGEDDPSSPR